MQNTEKLQRQFGSAASNTVKAAATKIKLNCNKMIARMSERHRYMFAMAKKVFAIAGAGAGAGAVKQHIHWIISNIYGSIYGIQMNVIVPQIR